jgi:lipopolysaccharide O-acetyltransferase
MKLHPFLRLLCWLCSIPARLRGVRFGKFSYLGPGYDFLRGQMTNITLGDDVLIDKNAWLQTHRDGIIEIGDHTYSGRNLVISALKQVKIGKGCLLSYHVSLLDHDHEFKPDVSPNDTHITPGKAIEIGENCFIGAHTFILKGVKLGKNCVVAANSVVNKSFPAYSMIAGSPASLIKILKK